MERTSFKQDDPTAKAYRREQREFHYRLRLQIGLICALLFLIAAVEAKVHYKPALEVQATIGNPLIFLEPPPPTREQPVKPPQPSVPILVEDDVILEDEEFSFDAILDIEMEQVIEEPPAVEEEAYKEEVPLVLAEVMPELIGGLGALAKEIKYPEIAKKAGVEGRVMIQFVVTRSGEITDAVVVRSLGAGCDEEALRALSEMKFKPGVQRGKPVAVRMTIPITFKLR